MQIRKNEITTGLFVLVTMALLILLLVVMGAPGLIKPLKTFHVLFDNASGIKPGARVLLAGRNVGQVSLLISPIPMKDRPEKFKNYEVMIDVTVDRDSPIYKEVNVTMDQVGLLGERIVDFTKGNEASGLAEAGTTFVGNRPPGLSEVGATILTMVEPVTTETEMTLRQVRHALVHLEPMLTNLNGLTGHDGAITETARNAQDFTDTIKREPWRLFWHATKQYPQKEVVATAEASPEVKASPEKSPK